MAKYLRVLTIHKRFFVVLAVSLLAFSTASFAQKQGGSVLNAIEKHDFGIFAGAATYMGDFNSKNLLYKPNPLVGLLYRYNINPYFALRAQAGYTRIMGSSADYYGSLPGFPAGGVIEFDRPMVMLDGVAELNFLPFSPVDKKRKNIFSPYLALGVGVNFIGSSSRNNNPSLDFAANIHPEIYGKPGTSFPQTAVFEIPIGLGVKVSPAKRLTLTGEWAFKKMFFDDIDGFTNRGGGSFSLINDDWVSTITASLTYRFASNWRCEAYAFSKKKLLKMNDSKQKTHNVNPSQSTEKSRDKKSTKMLKGRLDNDSNKTKKSSSR